MNRLKTIINILIHPSHLLVMLDNKGIIRLNDTIYLKLLYRKVMGAKLDLNNPILFNEKIQWLKINDRNEKYIKMVDKYEAKEYVANIIGKEYIIPTIGIFNDFNEINFDLLPKQFVIKCTHDSGGLIIVKDKCKIDLNTVKNKINSCLKRNYYFLGREWPYKNVKPRIIIEKYMSNSSEEKSIKDYKFFCFNGEPKIMYISDGSHTNEARIAFFDMNFNHLNIKRKDYNDFDTLPQKPLNFELMKKIAGELSKSITHVRIDFYEIDNKIYFGEFTFYTGGGFIPFEDDNWNKKLGDLIILPK